MRIYLLLAMAVAASMIGSSCGGEGVGDPCTPEDEYLTGFSGFDQSEVNVESRSFQCLTRVCLVNHFQGRVSCPYGQIEDPTAKNSGLSTCMGTEEHRNSLDCLPGGSLHRESCQVPDRDGARWEDRIIPPVEPQLRERQAETTVYCSCRCAGSDPGADYCKCPSGFDCEELVEDLGQGRGQLAGSYCIQTGTDYNPGFPPSEECKANSAADLCNDRYNINYSDGSTLGSNQKTGACLPPNAECEKDDTCCSEGVPQPCVDAARASSSGKRRNCFGTCAGDECDHGNGALETIYEVFRNDCDGSCPSTLQPPQK